MRKFLPVTIIFVVILAALFSFRTQVESKGTDVDFLLIANVLLYILSLAGLFLQSRHLHSPNANAFVRGVYSSALLKMLLIIGALFIFIVVFKKEVNKAAILISMGIYVLYSSAEVIQLMKMVKKK